MPKIKPFKATLYNKEKIENLTDVITPPYDVISSGQQQEYYEKSEYNFIRLILNREDDKDNNINNKYTRASKIFKEWLNKKILIRVKTPSLFIVSQEYKAGFEKKIRWGFISLMRLMDEEQDMVYPHEHTFALPKQDRFNLIKEVKANLSPVFMLFEDIDNKIVGILKKYALNNTPLFKDFYDDNVRYNMWEFSGQNAIKQIQKQIETVSLFIADGHHRYEVAKSYKRDFGYGYVMTYFSSLNDHGLTIFPMHRILKKSPVDINSMQIQTKLKEVFDVQKVNTHQELVDNLSTDEIYCSKIGVYTANGIYVLRLKNKDKIIDVIKEDKSSAWKSLDVNILHKIVMQGILKIKNCSDKSNLDYTKDDSYAVSRVNSGKFDIAFIMNAVSIEEVKQIAMAKEKMPQKTTYFYPKIASGIVINHFG